MYVMNRSKFQFIEAKWLHISDRAWIRLKKDSGDWGDLGAKEVQNSGQELIRTSLSKVPFSLWTIG